MHSQHLPTVGNSLTHTLIERIEDMDGNIVYEHEIEPVDVFSPETVISLLICYEMF